MSFELRVVGKADYELFNFGFFKWISFAIQFIIQQFVIGFADNS